VFLSHVPDLGGDVALKVFNEEKGRPSIETDAMKEYRLMKEMNNEFHILKPLNFLAKG